VTPRQRSALIGAVLLTAALLLGASLAQRGMGGAPGTDDGGGHAGSDGPGMMGGYGSAGSHGAAMMGEGYGTPGIQTIDFDAARAMIRNSLQDATVDSTANTVSFTGSNVTIDVIAVQPNHPDTTFENAGKGWPGQEILRQRLSQAAGERLTPDPARTAQRSRGEPLTAARTGPHRIGRSCRVGDGRCSSGPA